MSHVIHYEDDIFLADSLVRVVSSASKLEPDSDLVGETIINAAKLADNALRKIKDLIIQNEHLADRKEYIRLIARSSKSLAIALNTIIKPEFSLNPVVSINVDELKRIIATHESTVIELGGTLKSIPESGDFSEDVVTGDEMSELLKL